MSRQSSHETETRLIPLSVVFISIGVIIVGTVIAIWMVAPATMPQPVYAWVRGFWPGTAITRTTAAIPTPLPPAQSPEADNPLDALLPESPAQPEAERPSSFVSLADAVKSEPAQGQPTRIVIPQINLDAPIGDIGLAKVVSAGQTYYQWQVPNEFKAGWHYNSARLGKPGNTVLNGHHNIYGEVFRDLVDLNEGDEIILYDAGRAYTYQVVTKEILAERGQPLSVRLENAQWIAPTDDERVTLVTCWPYTDNSHRVVIVAQPTAAAVVQRPFSHP